MKKGYVIVRVGWEYNDEYYNRPEQGGSGKPVKVFIDQRHAVAEKNKLNAEAIAEDSIVRPKYGVNRMIDSGDRPITDYFEVVEVEMEA